MNRATGNPHENSVAGADLAKVLPRTGGGRRNALGHARPPRSRDPGISSHFVDARRQIKA